MGLNFCFNPAGLIYRRMDGGMCEIIGSEWTMQIIAVFYGSFAICRNRFYTLLDTYLKKEHKLNFFRRQFLFGRYWEQRTGRIRVTTTMHCMNLPFTYHMSVNCSKQFEICFWSHLDWKVLRGKKPLDSQKELRSRRVTMIIRQPLQRPITVLLIPYSTTT